MLLAHAPLFFASLKREAFFVKITVSEQIQNGVQIPIAGAAA